MNAPERLPIVRVAIDGAVIIPLNLIEPSPTNPRHRPNDLAALQKGWNLAELAESIKTHDVIQPIVVRPKAGVLELDEHGAYLPVAEKAGQPQYEIIAGERRWRASQLAGKRDIIALVRPMTDFEVLELQVIENLQREDLHPIEEGESYRKLMRQPGGTEGYASVDELAARLGKSRRYVYNRLSLCSLVTEARTACFDGHITPSTALLIARLPIHHQAEATKIVVQGFGGEPLSFRSAQVTLERRFMLQLDKAPFKVADASLVPEAGSCRECPKRTGANPDLFDDIKSADTCTDHKCFQGKVDAHNKALLKAGEEKGLEVITGKAAKKVMPERHSDPKGYLVLDQVNHRLGDKPLSKLLGDECPPVALLENPHTHDVVEVVREEQAMAVLKKKGVVKTSRMPTTSAEDRKREATRVAATAWKAAAARALMERVVAPDLHQAELAAFMWREVACAMFDRLGHDTTKVVKQLMGHEAGWRTEADEQLVRSLSERELGQLFVAMCVAGEVPTPTYTTKPHEAPRILHIADHLGVDVARIRRDLAGGVKKVASRARAEPASTPTNSAAAQGAKSGPQTPEEALAAAVAKEQADAHPGKKSQRDKTAKLPTSKQGSTAPASATEGESQKDNTAKLPTSKQDSTEAIPPTKGASQTDEPASPAGAGAVATKPAKSGVQISAAAAWPFPIGSRP